MPGWSIEYEGESFARFDRSLPEYEQRRSPTPSSPPPVSILGHCPARIAAS
jgi:hypothetical protein